MRYIILALLAIFSVILNGSFFSTLPFFGIEADILILAVLALSLVERSVMPIIFALLAGILTDVLYSPIFGFFTLAYTLTAGVACTVLSRFERINLITILTTGASGALLFETVCTLEAYLSGADFSFQALLKEHILPQVIFTAAALLAAYWLISKLMRPAYMKPGVKEKSQGRLFDIENTGTTQKW